jgi:predicted ATPase
MPVPRLPSVPRVPGVPRLPDAFVVTGIPGAGKSTVSGLLAARLALSAHVDVDTIPALMVAGDRSLPVEPGPATLRSLTRLRNAARVARTFMDAGVVPVVDDVFVYAERLRLLLAELGGRVPVVVLAPPLAVALERDRTRGYKSHGDRWAHLDAAQRAGLCGMGLWLNTAAMTADGVVDEILDRWPEGLTPPEAMRA